MTTGSYRSISLARPTLQSRSLPCWWNLTRPRFISLTTLACYRYTCCVAFGVVVDDASLLYLVEQGGIGTLTARNRQGALPLHILCGSTNPSLRTVQYLIQSFPGSVSASTPAGQYPFMLAAGETSSSSLSVVYELIRVNPDLAVPR